MSLEYFIDKLGLDEAEVQSRIAFFEIEADDLERLASLKSVAEKNTEAIVEDLYELILGHEDARKHFSDRGTLARVKRAQRDYFLGLFEGRCDLEYAKDRLRIGIAHERVGIPPKWYIGAYARYLRSVHDWLDEELAGPEETRAAYRSIEKLVAFDMALAMDSYIAAQLDALARHQAAIREMSTPVIEVHDKVLLLPLIGSIDTHRADQLMETVLVEIAEKQASAIIIDIAGVPVVDTKVADHLIKTTEAVRLLGAQTILSGISPTIAKTIVNLGMDISSMHTRGQLAAALEKAFQIVGSDVAPPSGGAE
jgi:rsbT co-antagonist protein RsbR